jgi:hypothetical protein
MNQPIKLTPTERRAVLRAAKYIDRYNFNSYFTVYDFGGAELARKYDHFFDYFLCTDGNFFPFLSTQNERVLMLLLFAEACK